MNGFVLKLVMAQGTPPLKQTNLDLKLASWWKKIKEDIFVFIKKKGYRYKDELGLKE
jgi:hypothetical protein